MARHLKWWLGLSGLACAVVGLVYLPPRGRPWRHPRFRELQQPTPYRLREQNLAAQWRDATLELELLEARDRLRPELARRRAEEIPGPAAWYVGPDSLPASSRTLIAAALDTIWHRLGIGMSKISVGVVIHVGRRSGASDRPSAKVSSGFLLPDSSDRRTCIAFLSMPTTWSVGKLLVQGRAPPPESLGPLLQNALGPCAFYAAFGAPGRTVAAWLGVRAFDLALYPWWDRPYAGQFGWVTADLDVRRNPQFLMEVYSYPPRTVACLGGRPAACRAAVLAGDESQAPPPHIVSTEYWWRRQALPGGDHYLADMVRAIGRERFRRFWNTELPVDTALAAALRHPIGEWTRRWQTEMIPTVPLGPGASWSDALLTVLCAAGVVSLVAVTTGRREVR